jgi:CheY-like chemotaxis protein
VSDSDTQTNGSRGTNGQRIKVLLVDDSPTVVGRLKLQLESAGFDVVSHPEGFGTLVTVLREKPDIILLDITMPGLQGPEVCRLIKRSTEGPMPVVLYSGMDIPDLERLMDVCGADGYIHKSVTVDELARKIDHYVLKTREG